MHINTESMRYFEASPLLFSFCFWFGSFAKSSFWSAALSPGCTHAYVGPTRMPIHGKSNVGEQWRGLATESPKSRNIRVQRTILVKRFLDLIDLIRFFFLLFTASVSASMQEWFWNAMTWWLYDAVHPLIFARESINVCMCECACVFRDGWCAEPRMSACTCNEWEEERERYMVWPQRQPVGRILRCSGISSNCSSSAVVYTVGHESVRRSEVRCCR